MATTAHEKIRIPFTVDGHKFEAVSVVRPNGQLPATVEEALELAKSENGGAGGEEDTDFLDQHVDQEWSRELWPYWLVTSRRDPGDSRDVRRFDRGDSRWYLNWCWLGGPWFDHYLMLRRLT